jgi:2-methylcitrate dehydratase PrpD
MELERKLANYVSDSRYDDLPKEVVDTTKNVILTILGTTIAGATEEGCEAIVDQVKEWGGKEEATILIYGGKVPAYNAVLANSTMARALDICDGMVPGMHLGSSSVPTALAMAELVGGCSGKEFLAAIALGSEVGARINFISDYDGFDPTGVCTIFATAAIAGKILHLNSAQMLNALALAFNKSGGSFQCNIDGALAVRLIQAFVSQGGIICAQLAQRGITGPQNFIEGIYGYFHLYAKDKHNEHGLVGELGDRFEMTKILFKSYPSCGGTIASTDAILGLVREKDLTPANVARIDINVTPYIYKLVGHQFEVGDNARVSAQFNIQYCVANALQRRGSRLSHFEDSFIKEPLIMDLTKKIHVTSDPTLESGQRELFCKMDLKVTSTNGSTYHKTVDIPSGFPGNPLTKEEHEERFQDYVSYGKKPILRENVDKLVAMVGHLEEVKDVRNIIPLLLATEKQG